MALLTERFGANGLYLLDEPEAALSPSRQLAVLARLHQLVGQGSQFLIATHSPILMAYPQARIYQLSAAGIETVALRDTEHYTVTRSFLEDPERMLAMLLEDE
jgi:predicted ATPase